MAIADQVALLWLVLDTLYLVMTILGDDFALYHGLFEDWCTHVSHCLVTDKEDLKFHGPVNFGIQFFNFDLVANGHFVLLSAGSDNREHMPFVSQ